ncbi:MAG: glycosyltransferase family 39 protein, partial [Sedimentisphaerales bacterium]
MSNAKRLHAVVNEKSKTANSYSLVVAALLVVLSLLLPSEKIAVALVGRSALNYNEVAVGTVLFRVGLGLLGLAAFVIWELTCLTAGTRSMSAVNFLDSDDNVEKEGQASYWRFLVIILTIGAVLRIPGVNSGLWYDEIATLVEFVRLPLNRLIANYGDQNNHPLFSLLARLSIDLFGESAWSLRLPALLFGLASLWALFLLARLVSDRREAFLATALMTVSYHHVWFSQNARGYTGQLFWCLLGTWLFIKGYEKSRPAIWVAYALSMALGMYTHLTTVFMLISHFMIYIFLLAKRRMARRDTTVPTLWPTIAFVLTLLFTFQLYALILPQVVSSFQIQVGGGRVEKWTNPIWAMVEVVRGLQMGFGTFLTGGIAVIIFLFGILSYAKSKPIVVALFVLPIVMGTTALLTLHRHFYPRFFFFELGIGILLLIRGCTV